MRIKARVDRNHAEIIGVFRKAGFSVSDTSRQGKGFPDCVVAKHGHTAFVEIKDGEKPPSARKLTADEIAFRDDWRGEYHVVTSVDDALGVIKAWPSRTRSNDKCISALKVIYTWAHCNDISARDVVRLAGDALGISDETSKN